MQLNERKDWLVWRKRVVCPLKWYSCHFQNSLRHNFFRWLNFRIARDNFWGTWQAKFNFNSFKNYIKYILEKIFTILFKSIWKKRIKYKFVWKSISKEYKLLYIRVYYHWLYNYKFKIYIIIISYKTRYKLFLLLSNKNNVKKIVKSKSI